MLGSKRRLTLHEEPEAYQIAALSVARSDSMCCIFIQALEVSTSVANVSIFVERSLMQSPLVIE